MSGMNLLSSWVVTWTTLYTVSTAITLLRLTIRWRLKRLTKSDALTAFCLLISTNLFAIAVYAGSVGFRAGGPKPDELGRLTVQAFFYYISAMVVVPLSKVCVTLLLLEVEVNDSWRLFLKTTQGLILLTALVNVTLCFFGCYTPPGSKFWGILVRQFVDIASDSAQQKGCVVREQLVPINGGLNVVYELFIFINAISLVFRVKTTIIQKAGLAVTFGLGFFTIAASIMNLYVNLDVYRRHVHHLPTGAIYIHRGGLWMAVEAYTGLIVASILPIRSTLIHSFDKLLGPIKSHRGFSDGSYTTSGTSQSQDTEYAKDFRIEVQAQSKRCALT